MVRVHKQTRQRYVSPRHGGDIVIDAKGTEALSQEILTVIGGWVDNTGSGGIPTKQQMFFAGVADELWGTIPWTEGARVKPRGSLGQKIDTTRLRRKRIYIECPNLDPNK